MGKEFLLAKLPEISALTNGWQLSRENIINFIKLCETLKKSHRENFKEALKNTKYCLIPSSQILPSPLLDALNFLGFMQIPVTNEGKIECLEEEIRQNNIELVCASGSTATLEYLKQKLNTNILGINSGLLHSIAILFTIYQFKHKITNLKIGILGKVSQSALIKSLIPLLVKTNTRIAIFTHPLFYPSQLNILGINYLHDKTDFLKIKPDVICYTKYNTSKDEQIPQEEMELFNIDTSRVDTNKQCIWLDLENIENENIFCVSLGLLLWLMKAKIQTTI
jgi:hypothetical protein